MVTTRDDLSILLSGPPPQPDWLIPGLIPKASMIALCGLAGVGKSVFGYTLAVAMAAGLPFLGRQTTPARTLYMDEENGRRERRAYIYRAWVGLGRPSVPAIVDNMIVHGFALSTSQFPWDAQLRILTQEAKPDLIVIDTATPACHIQDENSNSEASMAAQKLRGVMNLAGPDCSMIVMKHLRVDHKTGHVDVRGAKFWKGTVDAILYHRKPVGRPRKDGYHRSYIRPEKVRAFGLRTEIIIDARQIEDGNGCVLEGKDQEIEEAKPGQGE